MTLNEASNLLEHQTLADGAFDYTETGLRRIELYDSKNENGCMW